MAAKISRFDRANVRLLHEEIVAAAQALAAKHGLRITAGNGSYADTSATLKVEVVIPAADGAPSGREADTFRATHGLFGFESADLGREFRIRGEAYRLVGIRPRGERFPVAAERVRDGRGFKFAAEPVLRALGRRSPEESIAAARAEGR